MHKVLLQSIIDDFVFEMENDSYPYEVFCDVWERYDPIVYSDSSKNKIYYLCLEYISRVMW